jgi:hypothetical protein
MTVRPIDIADSIAHSWPIPIEVSDGRRMIIAPVKPTASAAQRRQRTVSPSRKMAPSVPNSGDRKLMAVTSPIGMIDSA